MDNPWYIIGGILVIVLLIALPFIRRSLNRKAREAGAKAGEKFAANQVAKAHEKLPQMVDQLGQTVVLDAPEERAREIVAQAAAKKPKDFPALDDGTFGMRFAEPTDGIVRLASDGATTVVQVERFREHMGYPMLMSTWEKFRKNITDAAAAAGITASAGPVQSYTRGALVEGNNAAWTRNT